MIVDKPVMLITGTRKGIGQNLAQIYSKRGFLVVGCSRQEADWEGEGYEHLLVDVGVEKQVLKLFRHIRKQYKRLDITLNNAGIANMNHILLTPGSTAERIMNTNFLGTFIVSRESAKLMMKNKWGRIINFSSVAVPMDLEGDAVYAASKSAVEKFTRILAHEVGPLGITANAIGPTPIETDLIGSVPKEKIDRLVDNLAIKRLGTFSDVVNVIDFLIRPESDYITGQTIYLGGS
ncbi:MAG: SDR family oxidoreductase [Anaerolineaceae bacterium]|nr:SDR family oxidoreductase [Anaerolineaceae bacterium]